MRLTFSIDWHRPFEHCSGDWDRLWKWSVSPKYKFWITLLCQTKGDVAHVPPHIGHMWASALVCVLFSTRARTQANTRNYYIYTRKYANTAINVFECMFALEHVCHVFASRMLTNESVVVVSHRRSNMGMHYNAFITLVVRSDQTL